MPNPPSGLTETSNLSALARVRQYDILAESVLNSASIEELQRVAEQSPDDAEAAARLGKGFVERGNRRSALRWLRKAVELDSRRARYHNTLGAALEQMGRVKDARACYERAIGLEPNSTAAYLLLGTLSRERLHCRDEALRCFVKAVSLRPLSQHYMRVAECFIRDNTLDRIQSELLEWANVVPDATELELATAHALRANGRYFEAEGLYRKVLDVRPKEPSAMSGCAAIAFARHDVEAAFRWYKEARSEAPKDIGVWTEFIVALISVGRYDEARRELANRASVLRLLPGINPGWRGEDLKGKTIVLNALSGFGDGIQFVRCAGMLKEEGAIQVIVRCRKEIASVLETVVGVDLVVGNDQPSPKADYETTLEAVFVMRHMEAVGASSQYIYAPRVMAEKWGGWLGRTSYLKLGICWAASGRLESDFYKCRSMPLSRLEPLASISDVKLFSLQKGPGEEELNAVARAWPITPLGPKFANFMETAAAVSNLDLVITVDTVIAHLAAALGKRTWIMLPFSPCFRWGLEGESTIWYPTVRLFRQPHPGGWRAIVDQVVAELKAITDSKTDLPPDPSY